MTEKIYLEDLNKNAQLIELKYQLKKPCAECPYSGKFKGYIGPHESAKEFHDIAQNDQPFPCHMSTKQSCVGNAVYMNRLCKSSRDPEKNAFQNRLRETITEVLFSWDGQKLIDHHGK